MTSLKGETGAPDSFDGPGTRPELDLKVLDG
jgi:hypothetical protein